jgi:DNA mismatch endonuclease (patch repair protein)
VSNGDLPGSPDIANRNARWAIFVHGCFWHRHIGCRRATTPTRNAEYWRQKFLRNVRRDASAQRRLRAAGWVVFVVWECVVVHTAERIADRLAIRAKAKPVR